MLMKRLFAILSAVALTVFLFAGEIHPAPASTTAYDTADSARLEYNGYSPDEGVHRWTLTLFKNKALFARIASIANPKEGAISGEWPTEGEICYDHPIVRIIDGYRDTCDCCYTKGSVKVFFTAISSRNNNVYHIFGYVYNNNTWSYSHIDGVWEVYHHGVDNDRPEVSALIDGLSDPIVVAPSKDAVEISWEKVPNAVAYQIIIRLEGEPVYEITLDADGNIESVNRVAAPARFPKAKQSSGYSITIDGLETGKNYTYELHAQDGNGDDLSTLNGSFQTGITTAIDEAEAAVPTKKLLRDGKLYIIAGERVYDATGRMVKK